VTTDDPSDKSLDKPKSVVNLNSEDGSSRVVFNTPPAPIEIDDLRAVFRSEYPQEMADELTADLSEDLGNPNVFWSLDILLGVASLSPAHSDRMRSYLGWTDEKMASEMQNFKESR
jgi:hypothetical protein